MNRKNLTAAVLAGLAGAAGIAGTAQAVNMNPDGLGQVLIYPYYTANDGNTTILSVVNTTENAKAVKVRFREGFNSRDVLDFNLYLSRHDVWTAAVASADGAGMDAEYLTDTFLVINDDSCTVPYLYEDNQVTLPDGTLAGIQPFLNLAYTGDDADGGPTGDLRTNEGYFEMIEMGTITPGSDTEEDITHTTHDILDDDGEKIGEFWAPGDCEQLVDNWTGNTNPALNGIWYDEAVNGGNNQASTDTDRNSGGLFGGAAVIHPANGAMWSYDAKAIQGYDKTDDGVHYLPGDIHPSLNDGDQTEAWVFFGVPQNRAVPLYYPYSVDAISAVFMHEFTMNEYTTADIPAEAATEWVVTFPTKNFYVNTGLLPPEQSFSWIPTQGHPGCGGWTFGDAYPTTKPLSDDPIDGPGPWLNPGWELCPYTQYFFFQDATSARAPFTELFGEEDCELVSLVTYDRDERTFTEERGGAIPPVVSPAPPYVCNPDIEFCEDVIFQLCYEVNVLRFGDRGIFGTPEIDGQSLLVTVQDEFEDGWGWIDYGYDSDHKDYAGLVGLPVTGFAAYQFENDFVEGDDGTVKAFYGGLFQHKGNVRRVNPYYLIDPQ